MKLNKKGITIIELIVSVALISVIMLFMYRLLADITFQKDNEFFASLNQEQRIEIIDRIESVLAASTNIRYLSVSGNTISFKRSSGGTVDNTIKVNSSTELILYQGASTILNKWNIKGGTMSNPTCDYKTAAGKTIYECTIKVFSTNNDNQKITHRGVNVDNNNTIDDITFSIMY